MLTFDEVQEVLSQFADELPEGIYKDLNGGIILLPDVKMHPESVGKDLYIMGEYHYKPSGMGRYITIYYGSFSCVHSNLSDERLKERLKEVLHHELTHHLEHKAGDRSLEIQDEIDMARYKRGRIYRKR